MRAGEFPVVIVGELREWGADTLARATADTFAHPEVA